MWKKSFPPLLKQLWNKLQWECSILKMIENWKKKQSDNGEKIKVIFLDLWKALTGWVSLFTIEKTKSIWFSEQALSLSQSYLCNIFQRSITNSSFVITVPFYVLFNRNRLQEKCFLRVISLNDIFCLFWNVSYVTMPIKNILYKHAKKYEKIKNYFEHDFTILQVV